MMNPSVAQVPNQAVPQQPQQSSSPTSNGKYDPSILQGLQQHMNGLPKIQQAFVNEYLTPETVTMLGIVGGAEVYDYFKQFADPKKMTVTVPRPAGPQGQQSLQQDQQANSSAPSSSQNAEPAPVGGTPKVAPTQA